MLLSHSRHKHYLLLYCHPPPPGELEKKGWGWTYSELITTFFLSSSREQRLFCAAASRELEPPRELPGHLTLRLEDVKLKFGHFFHPSNKETPYFYNRQENPGKISLDKKREDIIKQYQLKCYIFSEVQ